MTNLKHLTTKLTKANVKKIYIHFKYKIYFLHILNGHDVGFHFLIALLKSLRFSRHLLSTGIRSQIFGPRNLILSVQVN